VDEDQLSASCLWRRLDTPGHDAAWLEQTASGWVLRGSAVFLHGNGPACLTYEVTCAHDWTTTRGSVRGHLGEVPIAHDVARGDDGWLINGQRVQGLDDVVDLDLGFTPATNFLQLRRVSLAIGETADFDVAWLEGESPSRELIRLPQRYERRSSDSYWYESPTTGYSALLIVGPDGFARQYPGLWESENDG
jgi:hypothetical protein